MWICICGWPKTGIQADVLFNFALLRCIENLDPKDISNDIVHFHILQMRKYSQQI